MLNKTMIVYSVIQLQPRWAELSPELGDDWIDPDDGQCSQVKKIKSLTNLIN